MQPIKVFYAVPGDVRILQKYLEQEKDVAFHFDNCDEPLLSSVSRFFAFQDKAIGLFCPDFRSSDPKIVLQQCFDLLKLLAVGFSQRSILNPVILIIPPSRKLRSTYVDYVANCKESLELELQIMNLAEEFNEFLFVNFNRDGIDGSFDDLVNLKAYEYAGLPFNFCALNVIRWTIISACANFFGVRKKIAFVDGDRTLWDGIIGEDGLDGVSIDATRQCCHFQLQVLLKSFVKAGGLLALVSKNAKEDVEELIGSGRFVLKSEDFLVMSVGWGPKSEAIRDTLKDLRLGENDALFIDDNPAEIAEVSANLDLRTIYFDHGKASQTLDEVRGLLDILYMTTEDLGRNQSYRNLITQKNTAKSFPNQFEHLRSLEMKLFVRCADLDDMDRVGSLVRKTNQLNTSLVRYSQDELYSLMKTDKLVTVRLTDRYEDFGVIGVVVLTADKIELLCLSCRVMGRFIEAAVLWKLLEDMEVDALCVDFKLGPRNEVTKGIFENLGIVDQTGSVIATKSALIEVVSEEIWSIHD